MINRVFKLYFVIESNVFLVSSSFVTAALLTCLSPQTFVQSFHDFVPLHASSGTYKGRFHCLHPLGQIVERRPGSQQVQDSRQNEHLSKLKLFISSSISLLNSSSSAVNILGEELIPKKRKVGADEMVKLALRKSTRR